MGKINIICKNCGKEFQDYESNHRQFCCRDCKSEYQEKQADEHKIKKCLGCGRVFRPRENRTRFCGLECYYNYMRENSYTKKARRCKWCNKEYYPDHYKRQFCSKDCAYKWYSKFKQTEEQKQMQTEKILNIMSTGRMKQALTKPHIIISELLTSINISHINEYNIEYYSIDVYLPENKLMIEVMGDYWHTNPTTKFKDAKNIPQQKRIPKDKAKHTYVFNKYGIEILYLWESDVYNNIELCEKLIRMYIGCDGNLQDYNSFNYEIQNGNLTLKENIIQPLFLCG